MELSSKIEGRSLAMSENSRRPLAPAAARECNTSSHGSQGNETTAKANISWPESCRYFNRRTMDAEAIHILLDRDTAYDCSNELATLARVDLSKGRAVVHRSAPNAASGIPSSQSSDCQSSDGSIPEATVLFVRQKKRSLVACTINIIGTSRASWISILTSAEVLPSFLEILHTNHSGCARHIAYEPTSEQPEAFHLSMKVGDFAHNRFGVYARQSFKTGRAFVLFAGKKDNIHADALRQRMQGVEKPNVFELVLMLFEPTYARLEQARRACDFNTQELEVRTGHASLDQLTGYALPPKELEFSKDLSKDLQKCMNIIRCVLWACTRFAEMLEFLQTSLKEYQSVTESMEHVRLSRPDLEALNSALAQKQTLITGLKSGTEQLLHRVEGQMDVIRSLVAERDSRVTIEIAKAAKNDSTIMRGIAFVTMIFLPATFAATFFSMVFFHVGDEQGVHLSVDRHIWLYPALTVPVTLVIIAWYCGRYFALTFLQNLGLLPQNFGRYHGIN